MDKQYRHELKFRINKKQAYLLKHQLSLIMEVDSNYSSSNNTYFIRSLYFDDIFDTAHYEKKDGVEKRRKYRIRLYNYDDSFIRLECKEKNRDLNYKSQAVLTKEQCLNLMNRNFEKIYSDNELINEFISKCKLNELRPTVIVDYERLAYVFPIERTRITFDENVRSGMFNTNLFDRNMVTFFTLAPDETILEVKFNNAIPSHIKSVLMTIPSIRIAISKFALCSEKKEV